MATSHNPKNNVNKRSSWTTNGSSGISGGDGNGVDDNNVNDKADRNTGCGCPGNNGNGISNDRSGHNDKKFSEKDDKEEEEEEERVKE